jgi:hypothetical protein
MTGFLSWVALFKIREVKIVKKNTKEAIRSLNE